MLDSIIGVNFVYWVDVLNIFESVLFIVYYGIVFMV